MKRPKRIFADALSIEQMEARYSKPASGIFSFLDFGCCFDTQPPMPGPGH